MSRLDWEDVGYWVASGIFWGLCGFCAIALFLHLVVVPILGIAGVLGNAR